MRRLVFKVVLNAFKDLAFLSKAFMRGLESRLKTTRTTTSEWEGPSGVMDPQGIGLLSSLLLLNVIVS